MIRTRTAIGRIPAPTILHNFFWFILSFSFFDAVLYPAIRVEPWPERRMMLITRRREKTIQRIAVAGPLEISLSVISFLSLKLSIICNTSLNIGYSGCENRTRRICLQAGPLERMQKVAAIQIFSPYCLYFAISIRCRQGTISFHCMIPAFFLVFLFFLIYNKKERKERKKKEKKGRGPNDSIRKP